MIIGTVEFDGEDISEVVKSMNESGLVAYEALVIADSKTGLEVAREITGDLHLVYARKEDDGITYTVEDLGTDDPIPH